MNSKYFTVELEPRFTPGQIIQNDKSDLPFSAQDLVFDWQEFSIPNCGVLLRDINIVVRGEDGSPQTARDYVFYFARTVDGVAPGTLGTPNASASGVGYYRHLIGCALIDSTDYKIGLDYISMASTGHGAAANHTPNLVLEGEHRSSHHLDSRTSVVGFDKIYMGLIAGSANTHDFSTGVLLNVADGVAAKTVRTALTVDGTDATKVFAVGDIIAAAGGGSFKNIGTVKEVTSATSIKVDKVEEGIADDDEIINLTPLKIILSLEV
tara:strand:+ start:230 stop:1027 length:798 start_codon:yes stop_codon:yes gene_type:complete